MPLPTGDRHPVDVLLALIAHKHDQQTILAAAPATVDVCFVAHVVSLCPPWPAGRPAAVLAELADTESRSSVRALTELHQRAPGVPVCLYIPLTAESVRAVVRLAACGLATDVIIAACDDLRTRLCQLVRQTPVRHETAALRRVWQPWTSAAVHDVVAACITASDRPVSVADVARHLNRSVRTLQRQAVEAGLPPAHRVLGWCRLLRAAYRLDQPGATAKLVAEELGYPSSHALVQHLHHHARLTLAGVRSNGGFRRLAACVRAELVTTRGYASAGGRVSETGITVADSGIDRGAGLT